MTRVSLACRRIVVTGVVGLFACLPVREGPYAAEGIFKFGGDKGVAYRLFKDPAGRFEFEYPAKEWRPLPSAGTSLAMFARNDGEATLAIDYSRLDGALTASEIGTMAEIEVQDLKERHLQAKDFTFEVIDTKAGRGALIRYASVGTNGPERVVRSSIPVGQDLFRVIGIVPESLRAKYEPILMHMIQSFKTAVGGARP